MKTKFGELIDELKRRHGMSNRELAPAIGVNHNSLSNWSTGKEVPSVESKKKVCDYCGRSLEELAWLEQGKITLQEFLSHKELKAIPAEEVIKSVDLYDMEELGRMVSAFALAMAKKSAVAVNAAENKEELFFSAGGIESMREHEILSRLVDERITALGISESEFAKRCVVNVRILRQVKAGQGVSSDKLETTLERLAPELINPETSEPFLDIEELLEYCQQKAPQTCTQEGEGCCVESRSS